MAITPTTQYPSIAPFKQILKLGGHPGGGGSWKCDQGIKSVAIVERPMTRRQCLPLLQLGFGVLQRPHLLPQEIGAYLHKPRDGTKLYANPTHTYCCCHSHNVWRHWGITKTRTHVLGGMELFLQSFVCFDFCIAQSSCIDMHCPTFFGKVGWHFLQCATMKVGSTFHTPVWYEPNHCFLHSMTPLCVDELQECYSEKWNT